MVYNRYDLFIIMKKFLGRFGWVSHILQTIAVRIVGKCVVEKAATISQVEILRNVTVEKSPNLLLLKELVNRCLWCQSQAKMVDMNMLLLPERSCFHIWWTQIRVIGILCHIHLYMRLISIDIRIHNKYLWEIWGIPSEGFIISVKENENCSSYSGSNI